MKHKNNSIILSLINQLITIKQIDEIDDYANKLISNQSDNIDILLQDCLFDLVLIATKTKNIWNINQLSLTEFLQQNTDWNPLKESFFHYINQQDKLGILSEILIKTEDVTIQEKDHFRVFLEEHLKPPA